MIPKVIAGTFVFAIGVAIFITGINWVLKGPPDFFALVNPNQKISTVSSHEEYCHNPGTGSVEVENKITVGTNSEGKALLSENGRVSVDLSGAVLQEFSVTQTDDDKLISFKKDDSEAVFLLSSNKVKPECLDIQIEDLKIIASSRPDTQQYFNEQIGVRNYSQAGIDISLQTPKVIDLDYFDRENAHFSTLIVSTYIEEADLTAYASLMLIVTDSGDEYAIIMMSDRLEHARTLTDAIAGAIKFAK